MMKYLRLLAILLVFGLFYGTFATTDVVKGTVRIVDWTRHIDTSENSELTVTFVPELPTNLTLSCLVTNSEPVDPFAEVIIKKEDGEIVFHRNFDGIEYNTTNEIRIDVCDFAEGCNVDDGKYILNLIVHGTACLNDTVVGVKLVDDPAVFYVNTFYTRDVDILETSPDFSVMHVLPPKLQKIYIKVRNDGERDKVIVEGRVYDKYGREVAFAESSRVLDEGEEYEFELNMDLSSLQIGDYVLKIKAYPEDREEAFEEVRYPITISKVEYNPLEISLVKVFVDPVVIKPGDYVKATLVFRNLKEEKQVVRVLVWNEKYNIYKDLGEVELVGRVNEVPVVFKVPDDVEEESLMFTVDLRQEDKEVKRTFFIPVKIEKTEKIAEVDVSTIDGNITIKLTNLVEDIINYKIVFEGNLTINPKEANVTLGGKGDSKTLEFEVKGPEGEHKIKIKVYNDDTKELVVEKEITVKIEKETKFVLSDYLLYIVVGVIAVILVALGLKLWREREEKPSYE